MGISARNKKKLLDFRLSPITMCDLAGNALVIDKTLYMGVPARNNRKSGRDCMYRSPDYCLPDKTGYFFFSCPFVTSGYMPGELKPSTVLGNFKNIFIPFTNFFGKMALLTNLRLTIPVSDIPDIALDNLLIAYKVGIADELDSHTLPAFVSRGMSS